MKAYTINTEFDTSDKYIVDNIIARKSITLIVASPKKGKTALGLNLGICINEGIDFLENNVKKQRLFTIAMNSRVNLFKKELRD